MKKHLDSLPNSGPLFLLTVIVFVLFPFEIVVNNRDEIGNVVPILVVFLLCGAGFFAPLFLLGGVLNNNWILLLARVSLAMAVYFLLSDALTPLAMSHLETGAEVPQEPWQDIALQFLMATVLLALAFNINSKYLRIAWPVAIALVVVQVGLALAALYSSKNDVDVDTTRPGSILEFNGNIYQFVFDTYPGDWFPYVAKALKIEDTFQDFLYFPYARSNYTSTRLSVPSFTTGTLFPGGKNESLEQWLGSQFERSMLADLRNQGFTTTQYAIQRLFANPFAQVRYIGAPVGWPFVADIVLLRLAPTFLKQETFHSGKGPVSQLVGEITGAKTGELRSYHSYLQFKQLVEHESTRKASREFVFAHFYPPHSPYQLNRDGQLVEESTFPEQVHLATNMMAEVIDVLRKEGKYDKSLIIFQSDHGNTMRLPKSLESNSVRIKRLPRMSRQTHLSIQAAEHGHIGGRSIDTRTRALLLVKLPGSRGEQYDVSKKLVQLVDLPDLVAKVVGAKPGTTLSHRRLERSLARKRIVVHTNNRVPKEQAGVKAVRKIGIDVEEGYYDRYAVNRRNKWSIEDRQFVRW